MSGIIFLSVLVVSFVGAFIVGGKIADSIWKGGTAAGKTVISVVVGTSVAVGAGVVGNQVINVSDRPPMDILYADESNRFYILDHKDMSASEIDLGLSHERIGEVSPDGKKILFEHWVDRVVYIGVMNRDGSDIVAMTEMPAYWASWFPNSNEIVFESFSDEGYGLYTVEIDGEKINKIPTEAGRDLPASYDYWDPKISPDGKKVAYHAGTDSWATDVWVQNIDGSKFRIHSQFSAQYSIQKWCSNSEVAYLYALEPNQWDNAHILNIDSNEKTEIPAGVLSPSCNSVAFSNDNRIVIVDINSNDRITTDIVDGSINTHSIKWSPDGEYLLMVVQNDETDRGSIYTVRSDGSDLKVILPDVGGSFLEARFLP